MKKKFLCYGLFLLCLSLNADDIFGKKLSEQAKVQVINNIRYSESYKTDYQEFFGTPFRGPPYGPRFYIFGIDGNEVFIAEINETRSETFFFLFEKIYCICTGIIIELPLDSGHEYLLKLDGEYGSDYFNGEATLVDTTMGIVKVYKNKQF